jgi:hypothetical protein
MPAAPTVAAHRVHAFLTASNIVAFALEADIAAFSN